MRRMRSRGADRPSGLRRTAPIHRIARKSRQAESLRKARIAGRRRFRYAAAAPKSEGMTAHSVRKEVMPMSHLSPSAPTADPGAPAGEGRA